jgi:hypothetical protein
MPKLFKAALFCGLFTVAAPSFAQIHLGINFGPPPRRIEVRGDAPGPDYYWISGNYIYNEGRRDYDWSPGRWERRPSPYHVWVAPRLVPHKDHYDYYEGRWEDRGKHAGRDHGR